MVPNDALINAVRSLNYTFKRPTDRMNVYKERGGPRRVLIRKNAVQEHAEYASSILRSAGMPEDEIERFLVQVNN